MSGIERKGFGGNVPRQSSHPVYAAYVKGECVAAGTAAEVAHRMGVKPSAVLCGCAPSRSKRVKKRRVEYVRFYEEEEA